MAYTQSQIDALEAALATGARRVQYADRSVEYRDQAEMESLLARMKADLAGTVPVRQVRLATRKGFC